MKARLHRRSALDGNQGRGSNWIRDRKRRRIYWRDAFRCVWCGISENLCLDHVVPRAKGGSNAETNLVTSCLDCNEARGNKSAVLFVFDYWFAQYGQTELAKHCAAKTLNRVIDALSRELPACPRR